MDDNAKRAQAQAIATAKETGKPLSIWPGDEELSVFDLPLVCLAYLEEHPPARLEVARVNDRLSLNVGESYGKIRCIIARDSAGHPQLECTIGVWR